MDGLILDKMTGEVIYFYYHNSRLELVKELIAAPTPENGALTVTPTEETMSQEDHRQAVLKVKQDIINGKIFQTEVGFKKRFHLNGDTINIYEQLREVNPSPQMYYVKFGEQKLIGASPELLFRLRQGEMETFPLAGTALRGANKQQDTEYARTLLNDPKEIAEHNMIVDLHRNDIGRVCDYGSVEVKDLMIIERYSHVMHIVTQVEGNLTEEHTPYDLIRATFPAGTLSGAPKIRAMQIISEFEQTTRGPYGGCVGYFSFTGNLDCCITIRTALLKDGKAYVQAGGGWVADSVPESEFQETVNKSKAMIKALALAESFSTQ